MVYVLDFQIPINLHTHILYFIWDSIVDCIETLENFLDYDMVFIDLGYALNIAANQQTLLTWMLLNSQQCSVKSKFRTFNIKCGAAKIYGLYLGFSNSNLSSHRYL